MEFARHSDRVVDRTMDGLLCRFQPDTHQEQVYHFSVGPWRLAEYIWPNVSGRQFPVHRRWLEVIPAEGRIWTPSLYMGLLPLLLAISAIQFRRKRSADYPAEQCLIGGGVPGGFYSWVVVLAVVASFGWYALGWLVQEIRIAAGADALEPGAVGPPFGGLYWLMTVVLPGYGCFRYPAKLLVVAALGLSLLAARGWDETFARRSDRVRRWPVWLGGLSLLGAVTAMAIRPFWHGWLSGVKPDVLFGPLDTSGAANDLLGALVQTAVLCAVSWWLLRGTKQAPSSAWRKVPVPSLLLLLVAVDLAVANRWMVVCAPADLWKQQPRLAAAIGDHSGRVVRHPIWMPERWASTSSPDRLTEAMQWDLDTLWPKHNLAARVSLVEVHGAMMLRDWQRLLQERGQDDSSRAKDRWAPLSAYAILPGEKVLAGGERIDVDVEDVSLWRNPRHVPRSWIVHDADAPPDDNEWCRLLHDGPLRVEIEAELARPGMVVLGAQFYPGWQLQAETAIAADEHPRRTQQPAGASCRSVPILRTDEVMRGAWLPAGHHRLTYRYRPASFMCGALISGLGWLVVLACWTASRLAGVTGRLAGMIRRSRGDA
ncbi:MAG: hypothetical protein A2V70_06345 [Planctomycetes bacterium RBG_13_63_9]|nr:MAG: hypothetical protein A2V70_06345 [Planctomycetes bacterium RBG_13_63_9]